MNHHEPDFRYWWTAEEWSSDRRTGAVARIIDRHEQWRWHVFESASGPLIKEGTSTSRKGARAACRKVVRGLPEKPQPPKGT